MTDRNGRRPDGAEKLVRDIRRATRRHFSAEEKILIVLEGMRGKDSSVVLYRKEGIAQNPCYRWSKEFLEAGTKRFVGYHGCFERRTRRDETTRLALVV